MLLDLNSADISTSPVSVAINDMIERAAVETAELPRPYLGASIVGNVCLRKVQYDWWCTPTHSARIKEIFKRGHYFEERSRQMLINAGFKFAPPESLAFSTLDGNLRGHSDGVIIAGPNNLQTYLIYPLLWEHKAVNSKNWRAIERDGLEKAFPQYAVQIALYQKYLDVTNPALFTALNADTCEWLHLLVRFDAVRAQEWTDRATSIIEATRAGELLPRFTDDASDWRCKMCGHRQRCWGPDGRST
jgi:hypothetical protein